AAGVADRLVDRVMGRFPGTDGGIVRDVSKHFAAPAAAKAAHAMAGIEKKSSALLFAVFPDVAAGGDLVTHDALHRPLADSIQFRGTDRLPARSADVKCSEFSR